MTERARFREVETPKIQERFDYADTVRRQIERCCSSAGDMAVYPYDVQALENLIPEDNKDDRYNEEFKAATRESVEYIYKYWRGRPLGTPDEPILRNDPEDKLNYDPDLPTTISSPIEKNVTITDWDVRFRAAFNLFVRLGVAARSMDTSG